MSCVLTTLIVLPLPCASTRPGAMRELGRSGHACSRTTKGTSAGTAHKTSSRTVTEVNPAADPMATARTTEVPGAPSSQNLHETLAEHSALRSLLTAQTQAPCAPVLLRRLLRERLRHATAVGHITGRTPSVVNATGSMFLLGEFAKTLPDAPAPLIWDYLSAPGLCPHELAGCVRALTRSTNFSTLLAHALDHTPTYSTTNWDHVLRSLIVYATRAAHIDTALMGRAAARLVDITTTAHIKGILRGPGVLRGHAKAWHQPAAVRLCPPQSLLLLAGADDLSQVPANSELAAAWKARLLSLEPAEYAAVWLRVAGVINWAPNDAQRLARRITGSDRVRELFATTPVDNTAASRPSQESADSGLVGGVRRARQPMTAAAHQRLEDARAQRKRDGVAMMLRLILVKLREENPWPALIALSKLQDTIPTQAWSPAVAAELLCEPQHTPTTHVPYQLRWPLPDPEQLNADSAAAVADLLVAVATHTRSHRPTPPPAAHTTSAVPASAAASAAVDELDPHLRQWLSTLSSQQLAAAFTSRLRSRERNALADAALHTLAQRAPTDVGAAHTLAASVPLRLLESEEMARVLIDHAPMQVLAERNDPLLEDLRRHHALGLYLSGAAHAADRLLRTSGLRAECTLTQLSSLLP